jgi:hypothetical protein
MSLRSAPPSLSASISLALLVAVALPSGADAATAATNTWVFKNSSLQVETTIAISTADNNAIVVGHNDGTPHNGSTRNCGYGYTSDGGATWKHSFLKGITTGNGGSYERGADPELAYSVEHDTFHFVCLGWDSDDSNSAVEYASSSDGGATWSTPVAVGSSSSADTFVDKPAMAIDNSSTGTLHGRIYVAWTKNSASHAKSIKVSYLNGTVWSTPVVVSGSYYGDYGPAVAVGGTDGAVYVAWCYAFGSPCTDENLSEIVFSKSTDGGVTWSAPRIITVFTGPPDPLPGNSFEMHDFPSLSINPINGIVHLVYTNWNGSNADVMYTESSDGGQSWTTPKSVRGKTAEDQFFPWIATTPAGTTLQVCYYDEAWNSSNLLDVSCSKSTDGINFNNAVRVTTASSSPGTWAGDYIQNVVANGGGYRVAWADFRIACDDGDIMFGKP